MPDSARSSDPAVQRQLDRLTMLSPGRDVLGLERISELLARLGNPQEKLPPVFHVAGTNGKGSTCAFLRAAIEAAGMRAHVYSSPHLVRFNERIRIAGKLIEDAELAPLLAEVLDCSEDIHPSFFEATTAAAFLAFTRHEAEACIIEVGLGGRLDATNIIPAPAICGIAQLGIDHQAFLGETEVEIAGEKAGIAKRFVPLVTMKYAPALTRRIADVAAAAGAPVLAKGTTWEATLYNNRLHYRDDKGKFDAPRPRLAGDHQVMNAALAFAMLRHQNAVAIPETALKAATGWAQWPARLQHLEEGPLTADLPEGTELWLDGGHNPAAGEMIAAWFRGHLDGRQFHLVLGMLDNKDPMGLLAHFAGLATSIHAVPVPDHGHHAPDALAAMADRIGARGSVAADVASALAMLGRTLDPGKPGVVLILGSLYLAGEVLRLNDQPPE
ncbi:folylpolyglutamate synthase/dihydrofolate synthase family protein [Sphingomonas sp. LaA6.9]|uniref:bifunctional folylpolyglutamate synthase/dihydrofolate synthase n=1 Tax=Sphingomonas sp. LaA6.9 TaxID=2919914 RepID=UPI001F4FCF03|nr:folylpolyglutamate synthase/dihydrofolate synthase family protein [Sphingomonas sp. LaA6.9]MCJ8157642.1 bifunctional folylpolyglutamate synthase/dihydrofolate synthase [Sphingomonas sp. LaA6.9]